MSVLTFLSDIVKHLAWPIFFIVILLNSKKLTLLVRNLIESIPKGREVDITVGKTNFKIVPKDVEDRINTIKLEMKNLVPEIIIPSSVPYVDKDIEYLIKQLLSLKTFNIQIENIKDPDLLSSIGSYYFMETNISESLKYGPITQIKANNLVSGIRCHRLRIYELAVLGRGVKAT